MTHVHANPIDAVLFDYGQVLSCPPDPAVWAQMRSMSGLDEGVLHSGYWAYRQAYDRGDLTGTAYWHAVAAHAGVVFDAAQIESLLMADTELWINLNLPMVEWAGRLQAAGIRTGILSNIGDHIAEAIRARLPWLTDFHHCTWSHELHMAKPEIGIYLATAAALGTAPERILFLDDREDNIAGARAAGLQTLHYTTHATFEQEMRERGLGCLLDARLPDAGLQDAARVTATLA